mgnify:CR=1 FL=1
MWYGLFELPLWGYVLVTLALTHITIVSVTLYLHRCQAHRGLDLHPAVAHFFRFWLWLTTGMDTREWVAVHRKHHARVETEDDPHSPRIKGINAVLWRGAELYRQEASNPETLAKFGHGTPDDWLERKLYRRFKSLGVTLMALIDLVCFGVIGITIWAIQMLWIPFWAAGVINGLGHYWGYRNYEPDDASTNICPIGILIGGEELHNNHHAFPSSAKFALRRWEFDLGWCYIRVLQALGLAKVKRLAPRPKVVPHKRQIDQDTVKAVIAARLLVLASYGRQVIVPTLRQELHRADLAARRLLLRNEALLDESGRRRLERVLAENPQLRTVYEFRRRLQQVWDRSATTHEALLRNLQTWCNQAEASSVQALRDFAQYLRGYTLQT